VMDYHSYFLDRRVSLADEQSKQIEFVPVAKGVKFEKLYLYDRTKNASAVAINLELMNSEENGLGRALPGGVMRIYKKDALHGMVDFLGEDRIGHTAKNEKIEISIGNAFDIVPEYMLVKSESGRRTRTQSHKVKLSNRKDEAVTVFVEEKFGSYVNWKIDSSNYGYEVKDANTARFKITIEPDTSVDLEYTATETWQ